MFPKRRYSDGDLTLIYSGGDECSSGFQRMSVINFECNETAGERARGERADPEPRALAGETGRGNGQRKGG